MGIPKCRWCPSLAEVKVKVCQSAKSLECDKGRVNELTFTAGIDFQILVVGGSLTMKIFKHPGADPTWCPEKRANWVNGANRETTVHGKLRVCLLWCWDLYSGHLVPHYSGDAQLRDRRSNGYGGQCWGRGTPRCKSGLCSVCERGEGSCCRSNFRDWSPECSGHGSRGKHRCSDTNGECLKVCGLRNSDGTYRPGVKIVRRACAPIAMCVEVCAGRHVTHRERNSIFSTRIHFHLRLSNH